MSENPNLEPEIPENPETPSPKPEPEAPVKRQPVTQEILDDLFCGTEAYYPNGANGALVLTDGALFVRQNAGENGAGWLFDLIEANQPLCMKDPALSGYQFWRLETDAKTRKAVLICDRDEGDEAFRVVIPEPVDFPIVPVFRVWVETTVVNRRRVSVALLPSEH